MCANSWAIIASISWVDKPVNALNGKSRMGFINPNVTGDSTNGEKKALIFFFICSWAF